MRVLSVVVCVLVGASAARAQPGEGSGSAASEPEPARPGPVPAIPPITAPAASATTGTVEGTVESPDLDAPLAGATVTVVGTSIATKTDDDGHFALQTAPGVIHVRADFAGFHSEDRVVSVTLGASAKLDFALSTAQLLNETVVVVGSRTPRTNVETTVPVDVITAEEIARSGRTETGRILNSLSASFLSVPQTIADGSDHVDPASLRGLGPDQVLVLVNGKRRHKSALLHVNGTFGRGTVGTDLNAIASGSIKRIEILRDGAASQYGSDAIAGVINIVTKDATDVVEISSEAGITAKRDGAQLKGSANYGFKIGQKGFVNMTGEFLQRGATSRSGTYTGPIYSADGSADAMTLQQQGLTRDDFAMRIGESSVASAIGEYNLEIPMSDAATFYSFGDLAHRRGSAGGFYRLPYQRTQTVSEFYPNGFLPLILPTLDDQAVTVGFRRKGSWDVDASLTRGTSQFKFDIDNSVNASLGTASPTTFDAGTLESTETVANLDLLRKLAVEGIKSLALVMGSELRVENYQIHAGDETSYSNGGAVTDEASPQPKLPGAQVFPGFQPSNEVDRTRDAVGVYGGVESELSKNIAIDAGGRYEHYSDFGQSLIGKVATRVTVASGLALRAAASTGFRAPSLQQLWFSNVSTQFVPDATGTLAPTQVLTSNNASPVTKAFGIPKLREERSDNLSGGIAWRPVDNFSLTADGYFIRIHDRIVLTSQFASTNTTVASILAPFPGVAQAQFFSNAVDTDTKGVDIVGDWATLAGNGTLTLTGAANFSRTQVTNVKVPGSLVSKFGSDSTQLRTFFFGRAATNRLEDSVPHQKGYAALRYAIAGVSALVRADYYGSVAYKPDNPANDETFSAKVLFDVDLGYQLTKNAYFAVGADNLLDTFPDRQTKDANLSFGRFLYSRNVSQFGMNGGFYYGKLQLNF